MGAGVKTQTTSDKEFNCKNCPVLGKGAWRELNEVGLNKLSKLKTYKTIETGKHLFHQGDEASGIWCVISGQISMKNIDINGRSIMLRVASQGQTIGARSFFAKESHSSSATALTRARCCYIPKKAIDELIAEHPKVALRFLEMISSNLGLAHETVLRRSTMNLTERLAYLLMEFAHQFGTETEHKSISYTLPVSRKDLAELLGTCPESLSRSIRKLREEGVIHVKMKQVKIPSIATLQKSITPKDTSLYM